MSLWLLIAGITAGVLALLLLPLLRRGVDGTSRATLERAIHRDRLAEVRRDLERGLLTEAEAKAAETEISRQVLAAGRPEDSGPAETSSRLSGAAAHRVVAGVTATAVTIGGLAVYLAIGSPNEPGYPLAARKAQQKTQTAAHEPTEFDTMIQRLAERLEREPGNLEGWILLGRSFSAAGKHRRAAEAFARARELSGARADLAAAYADALVMVAGGLVTPQAGELFEEVLRLEPGNPGARYYLGLARAQAGEPRAALESWLALEASAPANAPWLTSLRGQIERLAAEQDIDLASLTPSRPSQTTIPGPTAEAVVAAQPMPAGEQQEMIRGMVARLASRLEAEPGDPEGWLRLSRSYLVLGERGKAQEAVRKAAEAGADTSPDLRRRIEASAREAGVEVGFAASTAPPGNGEAALSADGPTREQIAAALRAPPEEQMEMIRGMVERLAARLEAEPNDAEGWSRLGQSYLVLDEPAKAKGALARALQLQPENLDLASAYAKATLMDPGPVERLPSESVQTMRDLLGRNPRSVTALWYLGLAEVQDEKPERAAALWGRLLVLLTPETPQYENVKRRIEGLDWQQ